MNDVDCRGHVEDYDEMSGYTEVQTSIDRHIFQIGSGNLKVSMKSPPDEVRNDSDNDKIDGMSM